MCCTIFLLIGIDSSLDGWLAGDERSWGEKLRLSCAIGEDNKWQLDADREVRYPLDWASYKLGLSWL